MTAICPTDAAEGSGMSRRSDLRELIGLARGRDGPQATRAAARLMSLLADRPERLAELLSVAGDHAQPRLILGLTGAPGCGKSSLTDQLTAEFRRRLPDSRLGVIAVDPSSPFTGGAVLGDRVRMMRHATDPKVFIRSLATRGHLGGLALGFRGVLRVMGLIGCEVVLVETVGVGQSEVEIASAADLTAVILAPGQGDSVQMLKAGLMEAGDLFIVNKADREGSAQVYAQLLSMLMLMESTAAVSAAVDHDASHRPLSLAGCVVQETDGHAHRPVFLTSASEGRGIVELVDTLETIAAQQAGKWHAQRVEKDRRSAREAILEQVRAELLEAYEAMADVDTRIRNLLGGRETVASIARSIIQAAARRTLGTEPKPTAS